MTEDSQDRDPSPTNGEAAAEQDSGSSSEDATSPASSTSRPAVAPEPAHSGSSRWSRVGRFLAAPVLALVAVGVHFSLNVPDNPPPSPKEKNDGAKSKARAKKAKQRSKRRQFEARSDDELDRAWHRYRRLDFAREPELATWSRRTESIVNRAVAVARKTAFEGAPEEPRVGVSDTECRTVRCRFVLRSPYGHELGILRNTMKRLEADEEPVWRHFEARRIAPPEGSPEDESYLEVMVALRSDEIRSARLEVAESSPAKAGAEAEAEIDSDSDSDAESPND